MTAECFAVLLAHANQMPPLRLWSSFGCDYDSC